MSITTSVVYINRHSNSILYLPVFWLLAHTTVIIQAASSPAECLYRITRERSLQLTLSKPCFLLWPNSPSIESTLWHNIQEQEKGVISYAVLLQHFASRCSYLSVQLFFLPFTPLRIKHSRVLREESTQICKTKYKSIIIMSQLSSWAWLEEAVPNFSCSIGTRKTKLLLQSTAKESLIMTISRNTTKLILKVKQPLEKNSNSP